MILQLLGIPLLILALLHLPFWLVTKKKNKITKFDLVYPFIPMLFYFTLVMTGLSKQSLGNYVIEAPVIILLTLIGYIINTFFSFKSKRILVYILAIIFLLIIIFVLSMPLIPE
jgi:hypothetical protein